MTLFKKPSVVRASILALGTLLLGGALGGVAYWEKQRLWPQQASAATSKVIASTPQSHPVPKIEIPANATPEMREFLQNQQALAEKMEQLSSQNGTQGLTPQAFVQFHQQNAALLQRQSQLAPILAQQQNKNTLTAPSLQMPPGVSPQMKAYLTARDQLMRDQIAFMNQHRTDDLPTRLAAMQQWRKDNAIRLQQLQLLAAR